MSGPNERFTASTRSASFVITLSAAQIEYLLRLAKVTELRAKYHWYEPHQANFGTADDLAVEWSTSTVRSLVRRGLLDVNPTDPPCSMYDVVTLTTAGVLMVSLLGEASFTASPLGFPSVPLHPDDRHRIAYTDDLSIEIEHVDRDRRDPADVPYISLPFKGAPAGAGGEHG